MLRPLYESDVPTIREINELSLGYAFSLERTRQQLLKLSQDSDHLLIGYSEDTSNLLLGYVHAQTYESLYFDTGLNVLGLAVHPDYQGQGIGRQLLLALEIEAQAKHYQFIRLNSGSHRVDAHRFYKQLGYDGDKTQLRFIKYF